MYCGVASMCTCRYILKKHPMANLKHLSSLHMGLSETGESRNSLANHHVPSQMAMLWHVMPFWKYTQSSDTMHCSCCTTRTHWSGICIYIYCIYMYIYYIYVYILYIWKLSYITWLYTHIITSIPLKPLSYLISHLYTIPWICHEIPWQKKQDGTLSQSDLLGALDLASNSLAPSGTPRVPARSRKSLVKQKKRKGMGKSLKICCPYHLICAWKLTVFKKISSFFINGWADFLAFGMVYEHWWNS